MTASSPLVVAALLPAAVFLGLAAALWLGRRPSEDLVNRLVVGSAAATALAAALTGLGVLSGGPVTARLGTWFEGFPLVLLGDGVSVPLAVLAALLCTLVGAFSRRYLHRDPGYARFHLLLALFLAGVELVVLAGTLDLLVVGWELTGLSSALLIAFFHRRRGPVAHGLRAFVTYRVCDVGVLGAALVVHHDGPPLAAGLLLVFGSLGKAAQFPLGGWLPRAMEGPTPSSAIFYGAISVSLGPYLLLRTAPEWADVAAVPVVITVVGAVTAVYASLVGRAQTDIKSSLAFASMTQVGLVFVEIGLGWHVLALVHLLCHATMRSAQILRSPSLLHDHHHLEQSLGGPVPRTGRHLERLVPAPLRRRLYRFALERGHVDAVLVERVVGGLVRAVRRIGDADERLAVDPAVTR
ncbi:hypothetical protein GCM10022243_13780 [Saccharothrix violaceirubra]|uniref:NADH:ubiquinone oxidoreductase subunit 5 (Subunit L)/multisubunit Na+/H+ antiporter MnhA subunit n=1 Tax=Saccharothrix violaceirubra TaxID=413306 RepID=A0A7W7T628_9PSEU|nr:proton-conducting transporter membrane subunit [Saccharothrix violaceirubra]MBB4967252.1 NADH:ubiquinone oxidoreductase subunit 5 (subunit L)/multisubunit Na+/H+ antiporter MnhA subunit [Saccharothrix violaceirubra]